MSHSTTNGTGRNDSSIPVALLSQNEAVCKPPFPPDEVKARGKSVTKCAPTIQQESGAHRAGELAPTIVSFTQFCRDLKAPRYVWQGVLQAGCVYALTAKWGHGKTALMLVIALCIAVGRTLGGHAVEKSKVLYLCGENPADVQLRVVALALHLGISPVEVGDYIYFTQRPFAIDQQEVLRRFLEEVAPLGPFGLVVVDTGPAHSSADEENDNREMHVLAMALREFIGRLGEPAVVALMHPTKDASRDNLQPRGGGAFSGSIDGELCLWNEKGALELFHRTKFRGPGFSPLTFKLEPFIIPGMVDNFGQPVQTVIAIESNESPAPRRSHLSASKRSALNALINSLGDLQLVVTPEGALAAELAREFAEVPTAVVRVDAWRERSYSMGISAGDAAAKQKAFKRASRTLIERGYVRSWQGWCWPTSETAQ